jgi:hypothetical protein
MGLIQHGNTVPVSVRLAFPINMDSRAPRHAYIEVTDQTSRMVLLEIPLNAEQMMALLGASTVETTAGITRRLDRVGKAMEHGARSWPDGYAVKEPEARERAEAWRAENGWDVVELSQSHGVWRAIGRRWVAPAQ